MTPDDAPGPASGPSASGAGGRASGPSASGAGSPSTSGRRELRPELRTSAASGPSASETFSLAKLVLYALGAGVVVLIVATPIVLVIAPHSALAALIVALAAVVLMVVVIALVSRRMTAGLTAELEAHRARRRSAGNNEDA